MLQALTDRARIAAARLYGRQPLVNRAKRWLYARLATSLPALGRPCLVPTSVTLGDQRVTLTVDAHSGVGLEATMFGAYEAPSMGRLLALAAKVSGAAPTFLDVGANVGFYSIAFALAQKNARVIACEPGPAAGTLCARNIAAVADRLQRNQSSIELVNVALSDRRGEATLSVSGDVGQSSLLEVENFQSASVTVKMTTADQLVEERKVERVDVCKIDVEGAELDVLSGMRGLLERGAVSLLQVEVNRPLWARSGRSPNDLIQLMTRCGYSLLTQQRALAERDDWAIEDFIFFGPAFRALAEARETVTIDRRLSTRS
jgi:FkbM family methyltransferase